MQRFKHTNLCFFALLCLTIVLISQAFAAPAPQENISRYIPEADFHENMTPEEIGHTAHTIYWAQGIQPPAMPHTLSEQGGAVTKGNFVFVDTNGLPLNTPDEAAANQSLNQFYVAEYQPGSGWYDVKKSVFNEKYPEDANLDGVNDSNMCYVASASNLMQWWLDQNRDLITKYMTTLEQNPQLVPDDKTQMDPRRVMEFYPKEGLAGQEYLRVENNPVYRQVRSAFREHWESGGYPDLAMDFFFNGYHLYNPEASPNTQDGTYSPDEQGGLFAPVFGTSTISARGAEFPSFAYMQKWLKEWMRHGIGVTLGYLVSGSGHAITLWGVEYDENNQLYAVYIVDNNEGFGGFGPAGRNRPQISMNRYRAFDQDGYMHITTVREDNPKWNTGGNRIHTVSLLSLAREPFEYFLKNKKPMPRPMDESFNPARETNYFPRQLVPIVDSHVCEIEAYLKGNEIHQRCTVEGCTRIYNGYATFVFRTPGPYYYTGSPIDPKPAMRSVSGSWLLGNVNSIQFEVKNNIDAGKATLLIHVAGQTLESQFTILPAPMPDTDTTPELLEAPTPYGIKLKPVEGHSFSYDGINWRTDGIFEGLEPGKSYTFSARRTPSDSNHSPSVSPNTLTVSTADGADLGDPAWEILNVSLSDNSAQVILNNTGRWDTVTMIAAGYDLAGRMTGSILREVSNGGNRAMTIEGLDMPQGTEVVRAFLVQSNLPVCPSKFNSPSFQPLE